ncbi:hypothetical protein N0V90_008244 [Kalmusia sp. IMI 367209]|nr:hypothetical protein N0V90_008244 [Kalmusia sp. IMI 367209]
MRLPPSQVEAAKESEPETDEYFTDQLREAFLIRRARDAPASSVKSSGSRLASGLWKPTGERMGGAAAGWGPKGLAEGIGIDARSGDPKQKNSVAVDQDGSDLSYIVAVTIGTSDQEYYLLLDSAASNTWVMGETCKTEACGRHSLFGEGQSTTVKTDSKTFSITYGTGSVSGTTASDTFHIGSISAALTFGLANNVSQEFNSYPMDGILGLGKGEASGDAIDVPQVIETLSSENLISSKLYGLHLSRASDGLNDGELNMGEVNKDRFDGDLNWLPTMDNSNGFWEVAIADAGIDDKMTGLKDKSAIIDTGTSFIFMPEDDAIALHKLVDGYTQSGESFTVPCSTTKEIQVKFGSATYAISTKDWIGGKTSGEQCRSNIFGRQTFGENQWLMGDVFLKNVYTAFDFDNSKVGFGTKSGEENESSSSDSASASASATASSGESNSAPSTSEPTHGFTSASTSAPTPGLLSDPGMDPTSSPPPATSTANPSFSTAASSSTSTGDPILPPGASSTASSSHNESGTPNSSVASESSPPTPSQPANGSNRASASILALFVALASVSFLNNMVDMYI